MGLRDIEIKVREMIQEDDTLTNAGNCRNASKKIKGRLQEEFPGAKVSYLVHPEAREGDGVHYAVSARDGKNETVINPVSAPGFPRYIGPKEGAVPTFSAMKPTDEVK
jgi:hypothetical protein